MHTELNLATQQEKKERKAKASSSSSFSRLSPCCLPIPFTELSLFGSGVITNVVSSTVFFYMCHFVVDRIGTAFSFSFCFRFR